MWTQLESTIGNRSEGHSRALAFIVATSLGLALPANAASQSVESSGATTHAAEIQMARRHQVRQLTARDVVVGAAESQIDEHKVTAELQKAGGSATARTALRDARFAEAAARTDSSSARTQQLTRVGRLLRLRPALQDSGLGRAMVNRGESCAPWGCDE